MTEYRFKNKFATGWVEVNSPPFDMKTGDWGERKPAIDHDTCKMCGICYINCPTGCIKLASNTFYIDYDYCKGCGICSYECPLKAISME